MGAEPGGETIFDGPRPNVAKDMGIRTVLCGMLLCESSCSASAILSDYMADQKSDPDFGLSYSVFKFQGRTLSSRAY